MANATEFIGHSWTLEIKGGHTYITNALSAVTVSLDDPDYHQPNEPAEPASLYVPKYVLRAAKKLARRNSLSL